MSVLGGFIPSCASKAYVPCCVGGVIVRDPRGSYHAANNTNGGTSYSPSFSSNPFMRPSFSSNPFMRPYGQPSGWGYSSHGYTPTYPTSSASSPSGSTTASNSAPVDVFEYPEPVI